MDYVFYTKKISQIPEPLRLKAAQIVSRIPSGVYSPSFGTANEGFSSFHSSMKDQELTDLSVELASLIADWIDPKLILEYDLNTLAPGATLKEHTDMSGGRDTGREELRNMGWAVQKVHKVHFVITGEESIGWHRRSFEQIPERTEFEVGGIYLYNNYVPHSAENTGSEDRTHLIIVYYDDRWSFKYKFYERLGIPSSRWTF